MVILVTLMDLSYKELFKKIKDIELEITDEISKGHCEISEIPELFVTQFVALNIVVALKGDVTQIPFSKMDNLICLAACQLQSTNLLNIPQERMTWVSSNLKEPILEKLDESFKTKSICKAFVIYDYTNIKYLPDHLIKDRKFIEELCFENPQILKILLQKDEDNDLCMIAMKSPYFNLSCIPEAWRSRGICLEAFKRNYKEIFSFPRDLIDLEIIKDVLKKCEKEEVQSVLELLSIGEFDIELVVLSVRKDESSFNKVPYDQINSEMIFQIAPFLKSYETLHHIPEDLFNASLCHRLINNNPMLLYGIPARLRTKSLCMEAVTNCGLALGAVPSNLKNDELYRIAVTNNGLALKYVPTPYRDNEIPSLAVGQNGEAIAHVPEEVIDEVLCRKAIMQNPHAIYEIPKKMYCNEFFLMAIKKIPSVLKLVPTDMRTVEQCLIAIEQDMTLYEYIPFQLRENTRILNMAVKLGIIEPIEEIR